MTACGPAKAPSSPAASGSPTPTSRSAGATTPRHCSSACSAIRNDLGLLAEEYEPAAKRQQGNFPQAFSHVALINTAFNLTRAEKPHKQRADGQSLDKAATDSPTKGDAKNVAGPAGVSRPEPSSRAR